MSETPDAPDHGHGHDHDHPEIADPDQFHERERLRQIHDARDDVREKISGIKTKQTSTRHRQRGIVTHAVSLYIAELEPLFERTDVDTSLPDHLPWSDLAEYADTLGTDYSDDQPDYTRHQTSLLVFRRANKAFAEIKPMFTDDADEWEV